ncbi:MAG: energy coupling factor transporter S component ThiW [Limnochordia bacterium]|jgi:energy coupling factor transporter S component ThiW
MKDVHRLTLMGLLVAIGTLSAHLIWFPAGIAKAFPVQHAINVIAGVLLGPIPAAMIALVIGILRNLLGIGTLMAFPGGIIGAYVAGLVYQRTGRTQAAVLGEILGTGLGGALGAFLLARFILGQDLAAFFFVIPFAISSAAGAILAYFILTILGRRS